ncbi:hypothetical protein FNV43_RR17378 [Rhamnella rubrinervis]|uniref:Uncharacterized protein n=1 Tax=Rhamnella rubrinervis TaxID=2594499 RepID=A0A8K0E1J9_9ROSA|nr:hypothetical protein FNV43_RR17378 [Rhamnella rubrinervis]
MGRAPCCDKANVKKGPWSPEEDATLKSYIEQHGTGGNWIALPQKIGLKRCGKSCRLRWLNYLRPNIKHGGFSEEEDNIICSLYISIGSRWSIIAAQLPGRTDNDIKNYWNTRLKKKLLGKQRKEHAQARRANNTLKQEIMIKRESHDDQSFNLPAGFLINQTPYWQDLPVAPVMVNNQNYYHPPQVPLKDDQASIKNFLIKLGGRFSDQTTTTTAREFQYPMADISSAGQQQAYSNMLNASSATASCTTAYEQFQSTHEYDGDDHGAATTMFQGLENLQAELWQLIYSNPQEIDIGNSESFNYGMDQMVNNNNNGSTTTATTTTGNNSYADSGSWGSEMNSFMAYPPVVAVSDYKPYQGTIPQDSAFVEESSYVPTCGV